ncbi:hypothetical protein [Kordia zhangzhouensis]|uniref:hypothetical protein n=1 Tax=Kordia zhangzhouensis TaxID=1620405 RepID=UPI0006292DBE|nr:hypothetical protein [Kordia zhangzhouensis]
MELKYLRVNEKQLTEKLLISSKQVLLLKELLKDLIQKEVLVINTHFGLEVYYESSDDYTNIIKNILTLVMSEKRDVNVCFDVLSLQNEKEIQCIIDMSIVHVVEESIFLKYLKSMLNQVNLQQKSNRKIIKKLSQIWNETTRNLQRNDVNLKEIQALHADFQQVYINNIKDKVLKELITDAVYTKFVN